MNMTVQNWSNYKKFKLTKKLIINIINGRYPSETE
jgi:hypothetical protein